MNITSYENDSNLVIAEAYYKKMLEKNFDEMSKYLHSNVRLISPLAEISGKNAVTKAGKNFSNILADIKIKSKFSTHNQIMFAYDLTFTAPMDKMRAAVLMEFKNNLISKIELFYDSKPFEEKKDEIFSEE